MSHTRRFKSALLLTWSALSLSACSTMVVPVLRHETGETLGTKRFRVRGNFETGRGFALKPSPYSGDTLATEQESSLYRGLLLGAQGAVGVTSKLDAQLGASFGLGGGGGWRLGAKYGLLRMGGLAVAPMIGYGKYSGSGTADLTTVSSKYETKLNLSGSVLDLGVPISYRFSPTFALYSGVHYFKYSVSGTANSTEVSDDGGDLGANVGFKLGFGGALEGDFEVMFLRVTDPVSGGSTMIPFFGIGAAILF